MITQRRVFQAKVGQAPAVVAKVKEFQQLMQGRGLGVGRIYTDLYSGHTDRVAWEMDVESLGAMEAALQMTTTAPATQRAFAKWFSELAPLIEGATVELWTLEDAGGTRRAPARRAASARR